MGQPRISMTVGLIASIAALGAAVDANWDKLLPQSDGPKVTTQTRSGPTRGQPQPYVGSYQVECRDDKERNVFGAVIVIMNEKTARWRYTNAVTWNEDKLKVDYLPPQRVILSVEGNDQQQRTWDLQFSGGFREVRGSYKFIQYNPPPTRWRNYSLIGSRLEGPARGGR